MGDFVSCGDEVVIKEEVMLSPSSPAQTVLQGSTAEERCDIRLRPLKTLTQNDNECGASSSWDERRALIPATSAPTTSNANSYWREWRGECRGRSVRDRLRFALEHNNFYQDVTFIVGKNSIERISAHKLILRLGSPVLENILENLKGTSNVDSIIEMTDIEPFAFKHLLQFMYTDDFNTKGIRCQEIMTVLQAARRFRIQDLANLCLKALKTHINDETAVALCEMGKDVEDFELRDMALAYICRNAKKVFFSSNFMELSYANLVLLIENDDLEWDELSIFKSVLRWADDFCRRRGLEPVANNLRGALGEIVYRIRFPLMTAESFTFEVIPLKVLTSEEQVQVYKYLCIPGTSMREQLEPTSFNCKRRTHMLSTTIESKCKDEDSSLFKLKSESGESPHCQLSISSNYNDMTEFESEDTSSQVSSCLSSLTTAIIKKKRNRSPSPIKTVHKKKHVELFGEAPKKSKEKRRSIDIDNTIELENGEIEYGQFIEDCNRNPKRKEIELVKLSKVNITDHSRLQGKKVRLPKLKEFHIDINIASLKHKEVNALAGEINIDDYLFFTIKVGKKWPLTELWSLGINISLVINGITLLRIDHSKKSVVINKVPDCSKILESLEGDSSSLKSLVISQSTFPGHMDLFPTNSLETLVMLSITDIPDFNIFVQKFRRLKELCILSTGNKKVDLSSDLVSKDRLRKLSLGSTSFSASVPVSMKYLEELFLWRSNWDSVFEDSFPSFFPNLKRVSFFLGDKVTFKLLYKVLQIKTISEVVVGFFDWSSSSGNLSRNDVRVVTEVLESVGLSESDKSFVLTKNANVDEGRKQWVGRIGGMDLSQEEIFKNFQFYHLYSDYALFRS